MPYRARWLFITAIVMMLSVISLPRPTNTSHATDGRLARDVYEFPRDHLLHFDDPQMNDDYVEWLYYTGVIQGNGQFWGYQITLFVRNFADRTIFLYDAAISDLQRQQYIHARYIFQTDEAVVDNRIFHNEHLLIDYAEDTWHIVFNGPATDMHSGAMVDLGLDVTLVNVPDDAYDYVVHQPGGISSMGACAEDVATMQGYTYYYTHPALETSGSLSLDGSQHTVNGTTWMDHQWGNFLRCHLAWNWFSLRLDDGSFWMIFQLLDESGQPLPQLLGVTVIYPDGRVEYLDAGITLTPTRYWTHPVSDVDFALEWTVQTPVDTFTIVPYFDNQTPPYTEGVPYYWEGVMGVFNEGRVVGRAYLEVVPAVSTP